MLTIAGALLMLWLLAVALVLFVHRRDLADPPQCRLTIGHVAVRIQHRRARCSRTTAEEISREGRSSPMPESTGAPAGRQDLVWRSM